MKALFAALLALLLIGPVMAAPASVEKSPIQFVNSDEVRFAYRVFGKAGGPPLLLINRFRGTLDDWDPELIAVLARERKVIAFDNIGMSRSSGTTPGTVGGFAQGAARFIRALGYHQVDVLGFSMGGHVAQQLTLDEPALVRRLIIAGSGPGHVDETPPGDPKVWQIALKPVNDDDDFLFLFFKPSAESQKAGQTYRERTRRWPNAHAVPIAPESWKAQLQAAGEVSTPQTSLLKRIPAIKQPTLLANGDRDIMVPTSHSYEMFKVMPSAKLVLYPDSGHGFLFQHARDFGADVLQFLR